MDPALIGLDTAKAGAIVADMIVSYLAAGAPPFDPKEPNEPHLEDCRSTPVETGGIYIRQSTLAQVRFNQESTEWSLAGSASLGLLTRGCNGTMFSIPCRCGLLAPPNRAALKESRTRLRCLCRN